MIPLEIISNISTHSLTKRLTVETQYIACYNVYFNSQPHEEADISMFSYYQIFSYFNSQPHEEADITQEVESYILIYFNSQPHEEAD